MPGGKKGQGGFLSRGGGKKKPDHLCSERLNRGIRSSQARKKTCRSSRTEGKKAWLIFSSHEIERILGGGEEGSVKLHSLPT